MAAETTDWQPIDTAPEGRLVLTKIDDERGARNEQTLARFSRLWYVDEKRSMYVYYEPTHWKEAITTLVDRHIP